jgi:hypothetical protein
MIKATRRAIRSQVLLLLSDDYLGHWVSQLLCKARIKQYPIITERSKLLKNLASLSIRPMLYTVEPHVNLLMDEGN